MTQDKQCPKCQRWFDWTAIGSSVRFETAVLCPDCDYEAQTEVEKQASLTQDKQEEWMDRLYDIIHEAQVDDWSYFWIEDKVCELIVDLLAHQREEIAKEIEDEILRMRGYVITEDLLPSLRKGDVVLKRDDVLAKLAIEKEK